MRINCSDFAVGDENDPFGAAENGWNFGEGSAKKKAMAIPYGDQSANKIPLETALDDMLNTSSGRKSAVEIERLRKEVTPQNGIAPRASLSGGLTGSTDQDERGSYVSGSDAGDSTTRRSRRNQRAEDLEAAAIRRGRASMLDAPDGEEAGAEDFGVAQHLGLEGLGADVDMGIGNEIDYTEAHIHSGAAGLQPSSLADSEIEAALADASSSTIDALQAKREKEKAEALAKKREAAKLALKTSTKQSVVIASDTIKQWLSDTSSITKPRLSGVARLAAVYSNVEVTRTRRRLAHAEGKAVVYPNAAAALASDLVARMDLLHMSPAVWSAVALTQGHGQQAGRIIYDSHDPQVQNAATLIAAAIGTTAAAHAAAVSRGLVGLRNLSDGGGISDRTQDGATLLPCNPMLDPALELSSLSMGKVGTGHAGPALARLWSDHCSGKAKYPEGSSAGAAEEEEGAWQENKQDGAHVANDDYGGQEVQYDTQTDMLGYGGPEWNEQLGIAGGTPQGGAGQGDAASVGAESAGASTRQSVLAGLVNTAPKSIASMEGVEDLPEAQVDGEDEDAGQQDTVGSEGLPVSSDVDPHKMHEATVRTLQALAQAMTGPTAGASGADKSGKKRKSRDADGLAAWPEGDLADTKTGLGSAAQPISWKEYSEEQSLTRKSAAATFYQLLILKSMDIIHVEQKTACGDIAIRRTVRAAVRPRAPCFAFRSLRSFPVLVLQDRFAKVLKVHSTA